MVSPSPPHDAAGSVRLYVKNTFLTTELEEDVEDSPTRRRRHSAPPPSSPRGSFELEEEAECVSAWSSLQIEEDSAAGAHRRSRLLLPDSAEQEQHGAGSLSPDHRPLEEHFCLETPDLWGLSISPYDAASMYQMCQLPETVHPGQNQQQQCHRLDRNPQDVNSAWQISPPPFTMQEEEPQLAAAAFISGCTEGMPCSMMPRLTGSALQAPPITSKTGLSVSCSPTTLRSMSSGESEGTLSPTLMGPYVDGGGHKRLEALRARGQAIAKVAIEACDPELDAAGETSPSLSMSMSLLDGNFLGEAAVNLGSVRLQRLRAMGRELDADSSSNSPASPAIQGEAAMYVDETIPGLMLLHFTSYEMSALRFCTPSLHFQIGRSPGLTDLAPRSAACHPSTTLLRRDPGQSKWTDSAHEVETDFSRRILWSATAIWRRWH